MKINRCIVIFIAVILFNCSTQKDKLQDILTGDCYWDILDNGSQHPINSCYKFGENGNCNFYYYNFFDKERTDSVFLYDDGDVLISNQWGIIGDSVKIRANRYQVIRYDSDSVFLTATGRDTMVLIKNCKTFLQR